MDLKIYMQVENMLIIGKLDLKFIDYQVVSTHWSLG
jgi:hypothetical protein